MHIVLLLGSARKNGNSAAMAKTFADTAEANGHDVSTYRLAGLSYKGCQGCFGCKTKSETCILKDDLTPILEEIRECDCLALATPVYYGDVTGQTKCFIDRCFSFLIPNYPGKEIKTRLSLGKTFAMIIAQGHPREDISADIFPRYAFYFKWLGFTKQHLIRACGVYDLGAAEAPAVQDKVRQDTLTMLGA